MIYVYGIDLAQTLNYTAIIVTKVENKEIRIAEIKKYKNLKYPELQNILFDNLFKRFKPKCVCVDYTNEKSFAETMETKFHSSFINPSSSDFRRWKTVQPVTFTQETKLEMKQNAREIFENRQFMWPRRLLTSPEKWDLIEELREQMLREAGSPGHNGLLKFPKPEGHDNDLIIALELNLYAAKRFLYYTSSNFVPRLNTHLDKFLCVLCREGKHSGTPHIPYFDIVGGLRNCSCKICNGLI